MWWPTLLALLVPTAVAQLHPERELDAQWDLWKKTYRKQYNGEVRQSPAGGNRPLGITGGGWGPGWGWWPWGRPHSGGGGCGQDPSAQRHLTPWRRQTRWHGG